MSLTTAPAITRQPLISEGATRAFESALAQHGDGLSRVRMSAVVGLVGAGATFCALALAAGVFGGARTLVTTVGLASVAACVGFGYVISRARSKARIEVNGFGGEGADDSEETGLLGDDRQRG